MAEIEHFCDPEAKDHPKFDSVRATPVVLYSACAQMDGKPAYKTTIGEAVEGQEVFSYKTEDSILQALPGKLYSTIRFSHILGGNLQIN